MRVWAAGGRQIREISAKSLSLSLAFHRLVTEQCPGAMRAQQAAWEELPLGVQQRILMLTGSPCCRRVNKAWRDAFDAANDT